MDHPGRNKSKERSNPFPIWIALIMIAVLIGLVLSERSSRDKHDSKAPAATTQQSSP